MCSSHLRGPKQASQKKSCSLPHECLTGSAHTWDMRQRRLREPSRPGPKAANRFVQHGHGEAWSAAQDGRKAAKEGNLDAPFSACILWGFSASLPLENGQRPKTGPKN